MTMIATDQKRPSHIAHVVVWATTVQTTNGLWLRTKSLDGVLAPGHGAATGDALALMNKVTATEKNWRRAVSTAKGFTLQTGQSRVDDGTGKEGEDEEERKGKLGLDVSASCRHAMPAPRIAYTF